MPTADPAAEALRDVARWRTLARLVVGRLVVAPRSLGRRRPRRAPSDDDIAAAVSAYHELLDAVRALPLAQRAAVARWTFGSRRTPGADLADALADLRHVLAGRPVALWALRRWAG